LVAEDVADAADAIVGGVLVAVLGHTRRHREGAEPDFARRLADQIVRGVTAG
jgi:hypothetical protein